MRFKTTQALSYLLTQWSDRFTGEPVILPNLQGMPDELPRLVWESADTQLRLQVSPARMDLVWERRATTSGFTLGKHLSLVTQLFTGYLRTTQDRAGRLGCAINRVALDETPALTLAKHFCQERWLADPLNRPSDFELHAHKRFQMGGGFEINSWIRCKTGTFEAQQADGVSRSPIILVEQDFNTLNEEANTREYTYEEIQRFYELAPAEFDTVLNRYFPGTTA